MDITELEALRHSQILDVFTVEADPVTGEWIGDPEDTGDTTNAWDWARMEDTEDAHFDRYIYDLKSQAERALIVRWSK